MSDDRLTSERLAELAAMIDGMHLPLRCVVVAGLAMITDAQNRQFTDYTSLRRAEFVVAACNNLPLLLAEVQRLRKLCGEVQQKPKRDYVGRLINSVTLERMPGIGD